MFFGIEVLFGLILMPFLIIDTIIFYRYLLYACFLYIKMYTEVQKCRCCGNETLELLLDLGEQVLTGVFPPSADTPLSSMPIQLVKCIGEDVCGLVQMKHSGEPEEMYGMNYGYRSGLNQSMVRHLQEVQQECMAFGKPEDKDIILDIGSNDATLLKFYDAERFRLIGIDPTGVKFKNYYPDNIQLIADFFSAPNFRSAFGDQKAKIISSLSMFYDLEDPQQIVNDIAESLDDQGVWVCEQSYLPSMLTANAYDTICHEHLEYYAMKQFVWMLEKANMFILNASLNDTNGGSFRFIAAKKTHSDYTGSSDASDAFLEQEQKDGIDSLEIYSEFKDRVLRLKGELRQFLDEAKASGKTVFGLGASTKGNVILQYCGIDSSDMPYIAEVNEDKFGCVTPGTHIPIISQADADAKNPDYYIVFPWHFRNGIIKGMSEYLQGGGKLVFPLPELEIVDVSALN